MPYPSARTAVPAVHYVNALDFMSRVLELCEHFGASVTSYYRTPKHNRAVGGVPHSKHLTAEACDVVLDDPRQLTDAIAAARRAGLVAIPEADHLHLQRG